MVANETPAIAPARRMTAAERKAAAQGSPRVEVPGSLPGVQGSDDKAGDKAGDAAPKMTGKAAQAALVLWADADRAFRLAAKVPARRSKAGYAGVAEGVNKALDRAVKALEAFEAFGEAPASITVTLDLDGVKVTRHPTYWIAMIHGDTTTATRLSETARTREGR